MGSVACHVKSQAQIRRPDFIPLVVGDIGHAEKASFWVLPIPDKTFKHGYETGSTQIPSLSALQYQTRDHRYREIKLFALVSPAPRPIRPAQVLQISNHATGIVDAIEKNRRQAPWPLPSQELVC